MTGSELKMQGRRCIPWTKEEDEIVLKTFAFGAAACAAALPKRTKKSITHRATRLGLPAMKPRAPEWTEAEIAILRENYPVVSSAECQALIPSRSQSAIVDMAGRLGLKAARLHGHTGDYKTTPIYRIWRNMIGRCTQKSRPDFKYYGGRGIKVCARWKRFQSFYEDMGDRPGDLTLDRIDPNGDYEPSNCRWASRQEQAENQSRVVWIERDGKRMTLCQWADELGIGRATISNRYKSGLRGDDLMRPTRFSQQKKADHDVKVWIAL